MTVSGSGIDIPRDRRITNVTYIIAITTKTKITVFKVIRTDKCNLPKGRFNLKESTS
ncbi:MAG: hypothetical protein ACI4SX_03075 [Candidatus Fimenecus sp.]